MPTLRFQRTALMLATAALASPLMPTSALALTEAEVTSKLDSILVLMSVDAKGKLRTVAASVNGKPVQAYLAAISIAAAEDIRAGRRFGVAREALPSLRFAPVSLARFNQLLIPRLLKNPQEVGVIAPDPDQIKQTENLLIAQKVPANKARRIAAQQPMIFCPEPGLLVSLNQGPDNNQPPFIPCATELNVVNSIIQRGLRESPQLARSNPRVVAIPLSAFITYLRREPAERVGPLRILPSTRLVKLLAQLNPKARPTAPTR